MCGWWVAPEPDAIRDVLATALRQSDATRSAMGRRGQSLVESKYTWEAVGKKMKDTHEGMTERKPKPDHVEVSA